MKKKPRKKKKNRIPTSKYNSPTTSTGQAAAIPSNMIPTGLERSPAQCGEDNPPARIVRIGHSISRRRSDMLRSDRAYKENM